MARRFRRVRQPAGPRARAGRGGLRVLVVGEAPDALVRALGRHGVAVSAVGADAGMLDLPPTPEGRVDAALVYPRPDAADPDDETRSLLRRLRRHCAPAVRVVVTDDDDLASEALRHDADAWVSTTADAIAIIATIRFFADRRR